jgi:hypothetical protein
VFLRLFNRILLRTAHCTVTSACFFGCGTLIDSPRPQRRRGAGGVRGGVKGDTSQQSQLSQTRFPMRDGTIANQTKGAAGAH